MEGFYSRESVPVNQKLSDIFLQLHISERTGRGVPKITEVYGKETYEFRENSIVVSKPFTRVQTDEMSMTYDKEISNEDKSLEFCVEAKTIHEIMEVLGLKERKSARRHVKSLVEQGRLAMTLPDAPKSKNQKHVTIK